MVIRDRIAEIESMTPRTGSVSQTRIDLLDFIYQQEAALREAVGLLREARVAMDKYTPINDTYPTSVINAFLSRPDIQALGGSDAEKG